MKLAGFMLVPLHRKKKIYPNIGYPLPGYIVRQLHLPCAVICLLA